MHKRIGANKRKKKREIFARIKAGRIVRRGFSYAAMGLIACVVCVGAFIAAKHAWIWMKTSPVFSVRSIEIRGAQRIASQEIRRLSRLQEGMRILDVKPVLAAKAIKSNCWIRNARITRRLPDKVLVTIEERAPIALVNVGRIYYIDNEGVLLPLFPATYSDLPVLSGIVPASTDSVGKKIPVEALKRIQAFFAEARRTDLSLIHHLSQIDFSGESMVRLKIENSPTLIEIDDRQERVHLARLEELMDVLENSPEGMPRQINLCYSNLAYAQW